MDDELVRQGRFARLELRGRRSGVPRSVTVGFIEEPGGELLIAAADPDAAWSRNLEAEAGPVQVTVGSRTFSATAVLLDERDPRRSRAVRELILRYGAPSERLGGGPVFALTPTKDG
ncbi:MAG: nitroreductase family deazaflavin-dependent oxidoreductase [Chloroflexi bacterium]|nr:MAG: nitroreductase family deazaflavin-dependent oxidoreductase [Chloroflexota bacterium]